MAIAVETAVAWPTTEVHLTYDGHEIVLTPETDTLAPAVATPYGPDSTYWEALALLRRFLSALAWTKRKPIHELFNAGGGTLPRLGKGMARIIDPRFRADYLPLPSDARARLALSLYREGLSVNSAAFQFLSFYKIINLLHGSGADQIVWIDATIGAIDDPDAQARVSALRAAREPIGNYLHVSGRCAVAHAYAEPIVDPDEPADQDRISRDLPLIRALAEYVIEKELGVKSQRTVWREHLYELDGFRHLFGDELVAAIKAGLAPRVRPLVPRLSLRLRDQPQLEAFTNMQASVAAISEGGATIECASGAPGVRVAVRLDFADEQLVLDPVSGIQVDDDGSVLAAQRYLDCLRLQEGMFSNGELEVLDAEGALLGRSAPYLPVNIDPNSTMNAIRDRIARCEDAIRHREKLVE